MNMTRRPSRPVHRRPYHQLLLVLAVLAALFQPVSAVSARPEGPDTPDENYPCYDEDFNPNLIPWECNLLDELYYYTDGTNWVSHANWYTSTDLCSWYGVVCTDVLTSSDPSVNGHRAIKELNLGSNNLTGTLLHPDDKPDELKWDDLVYAEKIDLSSNNFTEGGIPASLGQLSFNLKVLDLNDCRLTGTVPASLGNLTALQSLDLGSNPSLTGSIPPELGNLSNLTFLNLSNDNFASAIPGELGQLSQLQTLLLDHSDLTGTIPSALGQLAQLKELRLNANYLEGTLPAELSGLASVEILNLSDNAFSGSLAPLQGLATLNELSISNNEFTQAPDLSALTNLVTVYMDGNRFSAFPSFGTLPALHALVLTRNQIIGQFPGEILSKLPVIDYLDFNYNGLNTTDEVLAGKLNLLDDDGNWRSTQTIPPDGIVAVYTSQTPSGASANLYWTPIGYQDPRETSYYEVQYSTSQAGPFTDAAVDADPILLAANGVAVTGLPAHDEHWVRVRSHTDEFPLQKNALTSEWSQPVKLGDNPVPVLTNVSPRSILQSQAADLILTGSDFVPGLSILWDGAALPNVVYQDTQHVRVSLGAAQTRTLGSHQISVSNPAPGGGESNALPVEVYSLDNSSPQLRGVSPSQIEQDTEAVLTLIGDNFLMDTVVFWSGGIWTEEVLTNTEYIDAQHLRVTVPDAFAHHVGFYEIWVETPDLSKSSNHLAVEVYTPGRVVPQIDAVTPASVEQFSAPWIDVTGTNFLDGAVVYWNGEALAGTQFIDGQTLRVQVPASLTPTVSVALVAVSNPGAVGKSNLIEVPVTKKIYRAYLPISVNAGK